PGDRKHLGGPPRGLLRRPLRRSLLGRAPHVRKPSHPREHTCVGTVRHESRPTRPTPHTVPTSPLRRQADPPRAAPPLRKSPPASENPALGADPTHGRSGEPFAAAHVSLWRGRFARLGIRCRWFDAPHEVKHLSWRSLGVDEPF